MAIERTEKPFVRLFLSILIGAGIAMLSVFVASLDYKTAIATIIGLSIGGIFIHFLNQKSFSYLLIMAMAFGIPFNLDINLFFRPYIGVTSVDIGITFLSCITLCISFFYERIVGGIKRFYSNKWIILSMLLYMGSGALSLYNAASKELVVLELVRLAMLLIICYMIMNFGKKEYMSVFILTLSITVFLEFLLAFYQYKTGRLFGLYAFGETRYEFGVGYLQVRASGTFSHANGLAYFFEMTLPILLAMVIVEDNAKLKLWYAAAFVFGFFGLVITLSRGGWLATAISLPIVFTSLYIKRFAEKKYMVALFFGLLIVMILGYFASPTIIRRLETYDFGAAGTRVPLNRAAFSIIKQFPITGVGLNNFALVFRTYDTTGGSEIFKAQGLVHNLFLGVWTETGIIGISTFVLIFITTFLIALKLIYKVPYWYTGVLVGVFAGLLAHFIHGMFDPGFRVLMSTSMLVYSMIGLVGAVSVYYKTQYKKLEAK